MKKLIFIFIFFVPGIFSVAYGLNSGFLFSGPMRGEWQTVCHSEGEFYRFTAIEIHEDIWTFTDWYATDKYCSNIAIEKTTTYQVFLDADNWNGKSLMTSIRPYFQSIADRYNQQNLCQHKNWKHGRVIEVTGKVCAGFAVPGYDQIIYSIYKTEGPRENILYIGSATGDADGTSEENRHREFSAFILIREPASFINWHFDTILSILPQSDNVLISK